jgi:signal transduction histidine kinase
MPDGGTLTIRAAPRRLDRDLAVEDGSVAAGDYVEIAVADTGCGMSDEVREHAFEPFFTTRPVGEGSGLGLSVVQGFARQSGGHAALESAVGRGTTLTLLLPVANGTQTNGGPARA